MQYPYNDDNMIFNYVTHRYVLTEKGVRAYAAVSLGESFKSDVANSITAFLNLASQQTYNIIHSYNVNTEVQDYIIATTKSGREMIQEAMINRLLFLLTERKIFDEAFYSVITRILPEINTSICYSGQVFRLDKPIKWEELSGEEESESSLVLIDKTITANGVYNAADDEANGYKTVYVSVMSGALVLHAITINGSVGAAATAYVQFNFTDGYPTPHDTIDSCGAALYMLGYKNDTYLSATGTVTAYGQTQNIVGVKGVYFGADEKAFKIIAKDSENQLTLLNTNVTVTDNTTIAGAQS